MNIKKILISIDNIQNKSIHMYLMLEYINTINIFKIRIKLSRNLINYIMMSYAYFFLFIYIELNDIC